jgi:hypothetical protein
LIEFDVRVRPGIPVKPLAAVSAGCSVLRLEEFMVFSGAFWDAEDVIEGGEKGVCGE